MTFYEAFSAPSIEKDGREKGLKQAEQLGGDYPPLVLGRDGDSAQHTAVQVVRSGHILDIF